MLKNVTVAAGQQRVVVVELRSIVEPLRIEAEKRRAAAEGDERRALNESKLKSALIGTWSKRDGKIPSATTTVVTITGDKDPLTATLVHKQELHLVPTTTISGTLELSIADLRFTTKVISLEGTRNMPSLLRSGRVTYAGVEDAAELKLERLELASSGLQLVVSRLFSGGRPETLTIPLTKDASADTSAADENAQRAAARDRARAAINRALDAMGGLDKINQIKTIIQTSSVNGAKVVFYLRLPDSARQDYYQNFNDKKPSSTTVWADGRVSVQDKFVNGVRPNSWQDPIYMSQFHSIAIQLTGVLKNEKCLGDEQPSPEGRYYVGCPFTRTVSLPPTPVITPGPGGRGRGRGDNAPANVRPLAKDAVSFLVFDARTGFLDRDFASDNDLEFAYSSWQRADGFAYPGETRRIGGTNGTDSYVSTLQIAFNQPFDSKWLVLKHPAP